MKTLLLIFAISFIALSICGAAQEGMPGNAESSLKQIARAKSDLGVIKMYLEEFKKSNGRYPTNEEGLAILTVPPDSPGKLVWTQYFEKIPVDPWGRPYAYVFPGVRNPQIFDIYSLGSDGKVSVDDIGNWKQDSESKKES